MLAEEPIGASVDGTPAHWLFTFTDLPPRQQRRARTKNAIERLHDIEPPSEDTAAMLFLVQIQHDIWQRAAEFTDQPIDLAA